MICSPDFKNSLEADSKPDFILERVIWDVSEAHGVSLDHGRSDTAGALDKQIQRSVGRALAQWHTL